MRSRMWKLSLYLFIVGFILNMLGIVSHVVVKLVRQALVRQGLLPPAYYDGLVHLCVEELRSGAGVGRHAAHRVAVVVFLALAISFPGRLHSCATKFRSKSVILLLYFLPLVIPQMTYGIPLATTLYRYGVGGSVVGVISGGAGADGAAGRLRVDAILRADQRQSGMDRRRMLGASRAQIFRRILLPLMVPGILTAGVLVLVNTISNFEPAFLLGGGGSQTLVVALFYNMFAGGVRPVYSHRCHGRDLHGDGHDAASDRIAVRAPDARWCSSSTSKFIFEAARAWSSPRLAHGARRTGTTCRSVASDLVIGIDFRS